MKHKRPNLRLKHDSQSLCPLMAPSPDLIPLESLPPAEFVKQSIWSIAIYLLQAQQRGQSPPFPAFLLNDADRQLLRNRLKLYWRQEQLNSVLVTQLGSDPDLLYLFAETTITSGLSEVLIELRGSQERIKQFLETRAEITIAVLFATNPAVPLAPLAGCRIHSVACH